MTGRRPRYSAEETARRGDELYERNVRAQVEADNRGRVVAIGVETGAYAVDDTAVGAARCLRTDHPEAEIWFVRIGHPTLHRAFGSDSVGIAGVRPCVRP